MTNKSQIDAWDDFFLSAVGNIDLPAIVRCELCNSDAKYASTRNAFNYYQCKNCDFLFLYPKPSTSLVQGLYTQQGEIDTTVQKNSED